MATTIVPVVVTPTLWHFNPHNCFRNSSSPAAGQGLGSSGAALKGRRPLSPPARSKVVLCAGVSGSLLKQWSPGYRMTCGPCVSNQLWSGTEFPSVMTGGGAFQANLLKFRLECLPGTPTPGPPPIQHQARAHSCAPSQGVTRW